MNGRFYKTAGMAIPLGISSLREVVMWGLGQVHLWFNNSYFYIYRIKGKALKANN